jgi:antitoxin CcdA
MRISYAHYLCAYHRNLSILSASPRDTPNSRGFAISPRGTPGAKRATNVSLSSELLEAARAAGVNLSATLERALTEELARLKRRQWREQHAGAIAAYNEQCEKRGTFSTGVDVGAGSVEGARSF